jgi:hypothetical protein
MSRLEQLPPDLRATLSLLLRQRKRPAEVAALLSIPERAVHDRAHAALALLAPAQARALSSAEREQLGGYLLGQEDPAAQRAARELLERSAEARAWAQALAGELAPLAVLPPIPSPRAAAVAPGGAEAPVSRVGGAVILGALAAVIVVVVLLIVGVGGGGGSSAGTGTSAGIGTSASSTSTSPAGAAGAAGNGANATSTAGASTTPSASTGSSTTAATTHSRALTLTAPDPATSKAIGVAYVLTQKGEHAFYLFAKGLPAPASGAFYAVWLTGARSAADYPLGSLPAANASGLVEGGGPLPRSAGEYTHLIVTSETSHHPSQPGATVLGGAFSLG